jgi:hypothetical protein
VDINNKRSRVQTNKQTPVNFGGMTGRALAVILKFKNLKIVRSPKKLYLNEVVLILTGNPVY